MTQKYPNNTQSLGVGMVLAIQINCNKHLHRMIILEDIVYLSPIGVTNCIREIL